jgi:hypothetical protein
MLKRTLTLTAFALSFTTVGCGSKTDSDGTDSGTPVSVDADDDGFTADEDCDDSDAAVNPDATEVCDEIDNDCDEEIDEDDAEDALAWYADSDSDGFGDANASVTACTVPSGYVEDSTDCDDTMDVVNPDADELCNGTDDDCDTEIDEEAIDMGTWYTDGDTDGYGDDATMTMACEQASGTTDVGGDCDDANAAVNPDAEELCDGVDNDCDSATSEDATVAWTDSSGTVADVTADVSGTASSPASFTVPEGDLNFCDGTYYVNLVLEGSSSLTSQSADPTTTILDGGGASSVVSVMGDGLSVSISDLTIQGGEAPVDMVLGAAVGGGMYCAGFDMATSALGQIQMSLDNVSITGNNAATAAGGLFGFLCDFTITNSTMDYNTSELGAAFYIFDGTQSVTSTNIENNVASLAYGAGVANGYTDYIVADFDDTVVSGNSAGEEGAGVALAAGDFTWTGTTGSGGSGIWGNTAGDDGGGLVLDSANFTATLVDFGTSADGTDNSPYDVFAYTNDGEIRYWAGDDASFECDEDGCGSATTTTAGGTGSSSGNSWSYLLGNVFSVDSDGTLDSFDYYNYGSCAVDYMLLSSSTFSSGDWDIVWASVGNTLTGSADWNNSGLVGMPLDSSLYYAVASNSINCDSRMDFNDGQAQGVGDIITGLGTLEGFVYVYNMGVQPVVGDTISVSTESAFVWYSQFHVTEL